MVDEHPDVPSIPYATPQADREKRFQILAIMVLGVAGCIVFIVLIAGISWPVAAIAACLSTVCIVFGHFVTSR